MHSKKLSAKARRAIEAYAKAPLKMKRSIPGIRLQEEERPQATISKEL